MADSNPPVHTASGFRRADDWESRAVHQVAARVDEPTTTPDEADDFGWEEGVLEKLRQRLNATD